MRRLTGATLAAVLLAISAECDAEVVAIDCVNGSLPTGTYWIDYDTSAVTEKAPDGSIRTYTAQVTATSVSWRYDMTPDGQNYMTWAIDRTSGELLRRQFGPNMSDNGGAHDRCTKSNESLPAVKF